MSPSPHSELMIVWIVAAFVLGMLAAFLIAYLSEMGDNPATTGKISQLGGNMITGVLVGSQGTFQVTWNGALQAGAATSWQTGDPSVSLSPSPDGDSTKVIVSVAASETLPSFGLTASVVASDGNTITANTSVPVLPVPPPPPAPATGGTIDQIA